MGPLRSELLIVLCWLSARSTRAQSSLPPAFDETDNGWLRTITNSEQITVYQPDVESWKGNRIVERAAVSVQSPSSAEPSYGVIWISARTEVDKSEHLVTLAARWLRGPRGRRRWRPWPSLGLNGVRGYLTVTLPCIDP